MAVMLETSRGDLVVDLFTEECPNTTKNFLKLCKIKYYNNVLFHNVQSNFIVQTGDPTGTGRGGESVYGLMHGDQARFFEDEIREHLKHKAKGTVAMASGGKGTNASQFYITTGQELDSLDGKHTVFGEVSEGLDVLQQIDEAFVDGAGRPLQNIRIRHTHVLDDPFDDPAELASLIPEDSPPPTHEQGDRLEDDWKPNEDTRPPEVIEEEIRKSEAKNRAVVLEMIGDLPEADSKPPSNMLFIAKLNQVTTEEDLETIFGRFGNITSCDIIRDKKTGDSLCYAFLGYDTDEACESAYFKMNNVLIDDRRIKVDFSQSVYHLWKQFRRFGREGGASDPMQQGPGAQPGAVGGHDRLQLKATGAAQIGRPRQQYDLLLEEEPSAGRSAHRNSNSHSRKHERPAGAVPEQARHSKDQPSSMDQPISRDQSLRQRPSGQERSNHQRPNSSRHDGRDSFRSTDTQHQADDRERNSKRSRLDTYDADRHRGEHDRNHDRGARHSGTASKEESKHHSRDRSEDRYRSHENHPSSAPNRHHKSHDDRHGHRDSRQGDKYDKQERRGR